MLDEGIVQGLDPSLIVAPAKDIRGSIACFAKALGAPRRVERETEPPLIWEKIVADHYDAKVTVLGEYIAHHVKEEHAEMFPKARRLGLDLVELRQRMEERKAEFE